MNAHESLLDNFSGMQDEFNSSNNRGTRAIDFIFINNFRDLEESLDYFNAEYLVVDKRELEELLKKFKEQLEKIKVAHVSKYQTCHEKSSNILKQSLCNFFDLKLSKGDNIKKKITNPENKGGVNKGE